MPTLTPIVVALVLASCVVGCTNTRPPERFAVDIEGESDAAEDASPGWLGSAGASDGPPMGACCRQNPQGIIEMSGSLAVKVRAIS